MTVLVIGPHPDDELLGAGGSLLRWASEDVGTAWCLVTAIQGPPEEVRRQQKQVDLVRIGLGIPEDRHHWLRFPAAGLDSVPTKELVSKISDVIQRIQPTTILVPHAGDAHSDHRIVSHAAVSASKWFRQPSVRQVMAYETLSETDQGSVAYGFFAPNYYVDIGPWLLQKLDLLGIYEQEMGAFPFPRSMLAIESLARLRGASSGFEAAEAFMLLIGRSSAED